MYYPNQSDLVGPGNLERALRQIIDNLLQSDAQFASLVSNLERRIPDLIKSNSKTIRLELQAAGSAPLNVQGLLGQLSQSQVAISIDTHANRPNAGGLQPGTLFYETDRTVLYVTNLVSGAMQWVYVAGIYYAAFSSRPADLGTNDAGFIFRATDQQLAQWHWSGTAFLLDFAMYQRTQSQLAALAALLGANDAGYVVEVTDFGHKLRWGGAAWAFAPGDEGSGMITGFPFAPTGGVWQICDGTATTYLKGDGTTGNFTTPNLTAHYLKFAGAYTATAVAAGNTANESAHTHAVDPPSTTSGNNSANVAVQSGAGTTVAADPHTHDTDIASFTSGAGSAHKHGPGDLDLARTELIPYFRR